MSTAILYFSGTGNTALLAQHLAQSLNCPLHSMEDKTDWPEFFAAADPLIILYPVYFSVPPLIFRQFLQEHAGELANKRVISIVSQMCYSGDGARVLEDFLPASAKLIDTHHINMPNNIPNIPFVPLASAGGNRRKVARALRKLERIAAGIQAGRFKRRHCSAFSIKLGEVQRVGGLKNEAAKKDKVWVSEACIRCGLCVRVCPTHNFQMSPRKAEPQGNCTLCLRCENKCPTKAISVILDRPLQRQYPGPITR